MKFTQHSVDLVKQISENMESHTFHHHYHILYDIRKLLGKNPINYVEIGAYAGGSACLMASHDLPTNCYSIDIGHPIHPDIPKRNVSKYIKEHNTWEYIQGSSYDPSTVSIIKNKVPHIDLLFIDGDHSAQAVVNDFLSYKDLIPSGGYIVFDDYHDSIHSPGVKVAVDNMLSNGYFKDFEVLGGEFENTLQAHPSHKKYINEFIIKKL
jgi:cephalosporin hydroxylase